MGLEVVSVHQVILVCVYVLNNIFCTYFLSIIFLGDDCSIKNCMNNCNSNGYCSYQFPTSRCVCRSGYYGDACQYKECLNNCSYPNGMCNTTSGQCSCHSIKDPFDPSDIWSHWQGDDCSYLTAWVGAA